MKQIKIYDNKVSKLNYSELTDFVFQDKEYKNFKKIFPKFLKLYK